MENTQEVVAWLMGCGIAEEEIELAAMIAYHDHSVCSKEFHERLEELAQHQAIPYEVMQMSLPFQNLDRQELARHFGFDDENRSDEPSNDTSGG